MQAILLQILAQVLISLLGELGRQLRAMIDNFLANQVGDQEAGVTYNIVAGIEREHPSVGGLRKYELAAQALANHFLAMGAPIVEKIIDDLIQAAVSRLHVEQREGTFK